MKQTVNVPIAIEIPDEFAAPAGPPAGAWQGNGTSAHITVFSPRPDDIKAVPPQGPGDHGGWDLQIGDCVRLCLGDTRFVGTGTGRYHDFGTLAEQAAALRKLATSAAAIAAELEQRDTRQIADAAIIQQPSAAQDEREFEAAR